MAKGKLSHFKTIPVTARNASFWCVFQQDLLHMMRLLRYKRFVPSVLCLHTYTRVFPSFWFLFLKTAVLEHQRKSKSKPSGR